MRRRNKTILRITALAIAVAMPVTTAVYSFADEASDESSQVSKYEKPNINDLTGHGEEPEELSVSAAATYQEKAWYEYVTYSDEAVCSYRLSDDSRLLFYDPFTYTNSMIMDVKFDAMTTEFDTMSSYTVSSTGTKTISSAVESTYTNTNATQTSGRDTTFSKVYNSGSTITDYNHSAIDRTTGKAITTDEYSYIQLGDQSVTAGASTTLGKAFSAGTSLGSSYKIGTELSGNPLDLAKITDETEVSVSTQTNIEESIDITASAETTFGMAWYVDKTTQTTEYSSDYSTITDYVGSDTVSYNTQSTTEGWTELSARVTKTIGSSNSTCNTWSESESRTVTKTYEATHFASDGVTPLPWAIVHYSIQMPMKCCLQIKMSGEWVTISTTYCLLTTVQGTCRSWMENGQTYYEDWGNGEPVMATDFWSQFMKKDQLISAYSNKLYPTGGDHSNE